MSVIPVPQGTANNTQFPSKWAIQRFPQTAEELYWFTQAVWGVRIPRYNVCRNHVSPFTAFSRAYFAADNVSVWKASRGFGGKTQTLSTLVNTEAVCLSADSSILGGSAAQSLNVHAASTMMWNHPTAPKYLLTQPPTKYDTWLSNGAYIRSLMASQTSVRGPHPQRLRLDEIDEMEMGILEAAQGQPMRKTKHGIEIETQTVMSSTHQYPDKTMSAILKRADDVGWPVMEWCWRESANPKDGWLSMDEIERKRTEIPKAMWDAEYDLQEPSFEGRAIDPEAVEAAFDANFTINQRHWSTPGYRIQDKTTYVTSVDWAKQRDLTVVLTFDVSGDVWYLVEFQRFNKLPWPVTVHNAEMQYAKYFKGQFVHDATGLGNVIADYFDDRLRKRRTFTDFVMSAGRARMALFSEYISAIENGNLIFPRDETLYTEHKYVTADDLYGKGHPPDSVVAGALAWWARKKFAHLNVQGPISFDRGVSPWDLDKAQPG